MTHGLSANAADALFFNRFGVESLPKMYIVLGVASAASLLAYASGLGHFSRTGFYPTVLILAAVVVVALRLLVALDGRWVYAVVWIFGAVTVLVTLTLMWNLAGDVADARSAKRLYPLFASAGILGGIVGNVLTGPLAGRLGTENVLVVVAAILAVVALGLHESACLEEVGMTDRGRGAIADMQLGFRSTAGSPLLRVVALATVLAAVLFGAVVFRFSTAVAAEFGSDSEIASFLGWFSAAATAATFLVSLLVTNKIFARLGIAVAILLVAATYVSGFVLWLGAFGLISASLVRFGQWVMTVGVGVPANAALFNVMRGHRRAAVLAFMFAVPANLGLVASGAFLWASERWLTRGQTTALLIVIACAYAATAWTIRARYRNALVVALRYGNVDDVVGPVQGPQTRIADAEIMRAGTQALTDPEAGVRRLAAEMLGRLESAAAVDALCEQLTDPDVGVRLAVVEALGRIGATIDAAVIGERLEDSNPLVRAMTVDVLAALAPDCDVARSVRDESPVVRARTAVLLARRGEEMTATSILLDLVEADDVDSRVSGLLAIAEIGQVWGRAVLEQPSAETFDVPVRSETLLATTASGFVAPVLEALADQDDRVRTAAVTASRAQGLVAELLDVLHTGTVLQRESALMALETTSDVATTVAQWATPLVEEATRLKRLQAMLKSIHGPNMDAAAYLTELLADKEWQVERLVVRALTQYHAPGTTELVLRGVRSPDKETRSQALEAIEMIGDRKVAGPLLRLFEGEPMFAPSSIQSALAELSTHEDPWIRLLSIRCIADVVQHNWRNIVRVAADDAFPLVRDEALAALDVIGGEMTETVQTLSTIDCMLFLRRVQLFASLQPQDLQKIAELATEEVFDVGETILRQGEPGDEIIVVVRGRVRLTKGSSGVRRVVGEYGEGEHVGELAVLRDAPRSADVEAATDDVRCLVIRGDQLRHLLVDRPRVSEAMLASLAERLACLIEKEV